MVPVWTVSMAKAVYNRQESLRQAQKSMPHITYVQHITTLELKMSHEQTKLL
jgi:hypothetical protein